MTTLTIGTVRLLLFNFRRGKHRTECEKLVFSILRQKFVPWTEIRINSTQNYRITSSWLYDTGTNKHISLITMYVLELLILLTLFK